MTRKTLEKIKAYSRDVEQQDALLALMGYYGKNKLEKISEEQALEFLQKLENGEVKV